MRHIRRRRSVRVAIAVAIGGIVIGATGPASADAVDGGAPGYAAYTFTGTAGAYTGTMALGGGFPGTTYTTNSTAGSGSGGGVGPFAVAFLNTATGPGGAYGSSRTRPYLNLRPAANSAASPSVTTYTFARPTPASGWMFTLGDIDADRVVVSAIDADGNAVTAAQLGFRDAFNYCGGTPSPCPRTTPPDIPTWTAADRELRGNPAASDTDGAAGWFEPQVSLTSLTFTYYWRSGQPVFQTWFANRVHSVTGTVSGCAVGGVTVRLEDPRGNVVATTRTADDGSYAFTRYTAAEYRVVVDSPAGCDPAIPLPVDLRTADATADVVITPVPPPTTTPTANPTSTPTPTATPSQPPTTTPGSGPTAQGGVPTAIDGGLAQGRTPPAGGEPGPGVLGWLVLAACGLGGVAVGLGRRPSPRPSPRSSPRSSPRLSPRR